MSKARSTPGLFQRLMSRPVPLGCDAADMGTAFGMEMSFDDVDALPAPPLAPRRVPGWVQRLAGRGKPAP